MEHCRLVFRWLAIPGSRRRPIHMYTTIIQAAEGRVVARSAQRRSGCHVRNPESVDARDFR